MITPAEIRGTAVAYHKIRELLDTQDLNKDTQVRFSEFLAWAEAECESNCEKAAPTRWARATVGPVLGAALNAATRMRDSIPTRVSAMRVFGVFGENSLSNDAAWRLMSKYAWEPVLSTQSVADIRRQTTLRLTLPEDPSPIDVLQELTRSRTSPFCSQVARWLADYFSAHSTDDTPYAKLYRSVLADLVEVNARGEMAQIASSNLVTNAPLTREEWESVIHGRVPLARLQLRAGYSVTREFIGEYWDRWNVKKAETVTQEIPEIRRA